LSAQVEASLFQDARTALRDRNLGGLIARTAFFNTAATAASALSGIVIARAVGPTVRGEYAAVIAWFGVLMIVGEVGQTAAVCFYVARDPSRARGYVATSRTMMLVTGVAAIAVGLIGAPALAHGNHELANAYEIAFAGSVVAFTGVSYTFALQAQDTARWNLVRSSQSMIALAAVTTLRLLHLLTLETAVETVIASMAVQLGWAYYCCRQIGLAPGNARAELVRPLARYGLSQLAAITPAAVNSYLDQLVLSQLVPPAALGRYAIAVSVTLAPMPLVAAIGNVAFPRLAASRTVGGASRRLYLAAVAASAAVAGAILLPTAAVAHWLIPAVFGAAYSGAVPLLWLLTPAGIFLACGQVVGDLLRGLDRPQLVAAAQGLAAVLTVSVLVTLLPTMGVAAAAIASTVSYGAALALMLRWLLQPPHVGKPRHRRTRNVGLLARPRQDTSQGGVRMRVGVIGLTWPDSFTVNIMDALTVMGHDPVALGSSLPTVGGSRTLRLGSAITNAVPTLDERFQRRLVRAAAESECEVVINLEHRIMPAVVAGMRGNGARVGIWYPDCLVNMGRQLMLLAPYDAIFVKDPYLVNRLRAVLDLPVFYLPEACNPRWHRPLLTAPGTDPYLVLAGSMYPSRIRLLERMMAAGIPLRLYGGAFPRWVGRTPLHEVHAGRCVFGAEKARVFRSAAGVLNNLHPGEIDSVNARLFEAAGCGAAVLTEFRSTLPDLFALDDEVLAFRDFDELIAQATRLLNEPGLSAKIGDAATARAHASHSYEKRLEVLLEKLA
jgi:O-antigen/teichoic acid export membrane protein